MIEQSEAWRNETHENRQLVVHDKVKGPFGSTILAGGT